MPVQIVVPLTSGPHHFELNLKSQSKNARSALLALVKEIVDNCADIPEVSDASLKMNYKGTPLVASRLSTRYQFS